VLEHVFNPNEHLSEIYRVLKPHGMLLMTVPFLWNEHEQPFDYARYSSFGIRHLIECNGFEIIEQKKSVADVRVIFQLINAYIYNKTLWIRKRHIQIFVTILLNAPFNLLGECLGRILPQNAELYLDNIILAKKKVLNG
jgi:SAM-dependent methyltransferase